MKIGVYGGTFNPIHNGHVHILREFSKRLKLDRVLLIPSCIPPHKQAEDLAPAEDRLAMCRCAAEDLADVDVAVSDMEIRRGGQSYTSDTLLKLNRDYPGDSIYLLMGEDMFLTVDRWHEAGTIFRLATLCASPRSADGFQKLTSFQNVLKERYGAVSVVENIPYLAVSSTEIREKIKAGRGLEGLLPRRVEAYIREHRVYGGQKGTE